MDKQSVKYPYHRILFNNKKEWSIDACYNMGEPQEYLAKWDKAISKIIYCVIPFYKMSLYANKEWQISSFGDQGGQCGVIVNVYSVSFVVRKIF